ncbi:MAG TPA: oligosaccharide flippase family protein [Polyangiaceae bacterium]
MTLGRTAVRGALWTIAAGMGSRAIGLVGTLVVTRFLAPAEYGEVTVAAVLVMTANQFSTAGLGQFIVARPDAPRGAAFHATVFHLVLGIAALFVLLGFGDRLGAAVDAPRMARFLPGLALGMLLDRVAFVPERVLARDLRFGALGLTRAGGDVAHSVVSVTLAAFGWGGAAIVWGNVARSVVRFVAFVATAPLGEWLAPCRLTLRQTRELLAFGVPVALGSLCAFAARRWDNLLVSRFFGPGPTGMYNLAYNLADVPAIQIGEQIGDVLVPSFARLDGQRRSEALVSSLSLLGLVVFPLAVGLAAVAPTVVAAIFDARWRPIAPMLVLLSALSVTRPIGWTIQSYLQARQRPAYILWLEAFKLVALVAGIVTFGRVSILLTCAAVGVAFGLHALASLLVVRYLDAVPLGRMLSGLAGALAACAVMAAAVLLARSLLGLQGLAPALALAVEVAIGTAAYVLGAFVFARSASQELLRRVLDATFARSHPAHEAPE